MAGPTGQTGPLSRLVSVVVMFLLLVASIVFIAAGAVLVGLAVLFAPVIAWWQRRRLRDRGGVRSEGPVGADAVLPDEPPPIVIDAEFTAPKTRPEE